MAAPDHRATHCPEKNTLYYKEFPLMALSPDVFLLDISGHSDSKINFLICLFFSFSLKKPLKAHKTWVILQTNFIKTILVLFYLNSYRTVIEKEFHGINVNYIWQKNQHSHVLLITQLGAIPNLFDPAVCVLSPRTVQFIPIQVECQSHTPTRDLNM